MSEAEQVTLKESDNPIPESPKSTLWRSVVSYIFRYFLLVSGICTVLFFISTLVGTFDGESGVYLEVFKRTGKFAFFIVLAAFVGPFAAFGTGGGSIAFLAMYAFSIIALIRGYQCRDRWVGKALGISGIILWLFSGLMSLGQHA